MSQRKQIGELLEEFSPKPLICNRHRGEDCMLSNISYELIFKIWDVISDTPVDAKRFFEDTKYRKNVLTIFSRYQIAKEHKIYTEYDRYPNADDSEIEKLSRERLSKKTYKGESCERNIPHNLLTKAGAFMKKIDLPQDFIKEDAKWDCLKLYHYFHLNPEHSASAICQRGDSGEEDPSCRMMDYFNTPKMYRDFVFTMAALGKLG